MNLCTQHTPKQGPRAVAEAVIASFLRHACQIRRNGDVLYVVAIERMRPCMNACLDPIDG